MLRMEEKLNFGTQYKFMKKLNTILLIVILLLVSNAVNWYFTTEFHEGVRANELKTQETNLQGELNNAVQQIQFNTINELIKLSEQCTPITVGDVELPIVNKACQIQE